MKKIVCIFVVLLIVGTVAVYTFCPSFRTTIRGTAQKVTTWTEEDMQNDPIGYSNFVESQLKKDLEKHISTRQSLAHELGSISKMLKEKSQQLTDGETLKELYAEKIEEKKFPVTLIDKEYTELQLKTQLSLLLAETKGLRESISEMNDTITIGQKQNEKIVVQIEKTESQIKILATKREIFKADKLTAEGLAMLKNCKMVLEENQTIISDNPVRSISELMAQINSKKENEDKASEESVDQYLKEYAAKKNANVQTTNIPPAPGTAPAQAAPAQAAPAQAAPAQAAPAQAAPIAKKDAPAQAAPIAKKDAPAQAAPIAKKDAPAQAAPIAKKDTTVQTKNIPAPPAKNTK